MVERCDGCPYSGGAVGTRGDPEASICVVGEAPGSQELQKGIPFIGQSGQLLGKILGQLGVTDDGIYVTNALRCRPPIGSPPSREGIDACRPRLLEEVGSAHRDVVLALGNSAVRSLTGNHNLKITTARGKAILSPEGYVILPTFHPALILRAPGEFPRMLADIRYGVQIAKNGGRVKQLGDTHYTVATTKTLSIIVDFLLQFEYLATDIETSGLNARMDKVLCIGIAFAKNRVVTIPRHLLASQHLRRLFNDRRPKWIWHNGKYDTGFLRRAHLMARVDEDTMLMHYCLNEQRGTHDLGQLGGDYLGAPDWKNEMFLKAQAGGYVKSKDDSWENIPTDILYPYNAKDADVTYQLFFALKQQLERPQNAGLPELYKDLLIPASRFLLQVEARGMWVHTPTLNALDKHFSALLRQRMVVVQDVARPMWDPVLYTKTMGAVKVPKIFNPGSPKQVLYILRHKMGLKVLNTREDTLKELKGKSPFVDALLDYRETAKAYGTYVEGIRERMEVDGRVHSTYLIHGTTTGRLSSRNPNMQNIPRDKTIRNIFQSPPGFRFIELDYSQVELRVLAHLSGDEFLTQCYLDGRDLHNEVSAAIFGSNYTSEQRVRAKFLNFGIAYGRGAESIVEEFGIPFREAQEMVRAWWRRAPQAYAFVSDCRRAPQRAGVLTSPFGRRRRFGLITRENLVPLQNEAANFPMQSTASDLTLSSAMIAQPHLVNTWGAYVTNVVHDSILIEAPLEIPVESITEYVVRIMRKVPKDKLSTDIPFEVSIHSGHRWGDFK